MPKVVNVCGCAHSSNQLYDTLNHSISQNLFGFLFFTYNMHVGKVYARLCLLGSFVHQDSPGAGAIPLIFPKVLPEAAQGCSQLCWLVDRPQRACRKVYSVGAFSPSLFLFGSHCGLHHRPAFFFTFHDLLDVHPHTQQSPVFLNLQRKMCFAGAHKGSGWGAGDHPQLAPWVASLGFLPASPTSSPPPRAGVGLLPLQFSGLTVDKNSFLCSSIPAEKG